MNDAKRIAEIRERERAATPGEWQVPHLACDDVECNCPHVLADGYMGSICDVMADNGLPVSEGGNDCPPLEEAKANARFIAHARSDIPRLLEKVEDLQGRLDRLSEIELLAHDVCWNNCSPARLKELVRENPLARSTAAAAQEKP